MAKTFRVFATADTNPAELPREGWADVKADDGEEAAFKAAGKLAVAHGEAMAYVGLGTVSHESGIPMVVQSYRLTRGATSK